MAKNSQKKLMEAEADRSDDFSLPVIHPSETKAQDHHSSLPPEAAAAAVAHNGSEHQAPHSGDMHHSHGLPQLFSDTFLHADQLYFADIGTLNSSGVTGKAILALNENADGTATLTVEIAATGLDANQLHPIHIHGFETGTPDSQVPTSSDDLDHDGFIEVAEGAHDYGPILLSLTHDGSFPTAPDGTFVFTQTYLLPSMPVPGSLPVLSELGLTPDIPLDLREIVIHGLELPHDGSGLGCGTCGGPAPDEADGTPGYKTVLPVAAGEIQESHGNSALAQFAHYLEGHFFV